MSRDATRLWSARLARRIRARQRRRALVPWLVAALTVLASASLIAAPRGAGPGSEPLVEVRVAERAPTTPAAAPRVPRTPAVAPPRPAAGPAGTDRLVDLTL